MNAAKPCRLSIRGAAMPMGDGTAWTREFRDWLLKTIPAPEEG